MYHDAFEKIPLEESTKILELVNPALEGVTFDPHYAVILANDIPFYKGYRFLDVSDTQNSPALHRYIVMGPDGSFQVLDWTNAPIYALNEAVPIKLSKTSIGDYVRFFFKYVRGPQGAFLLAENIDDLDWKEDPPTPARKALGQMLMPLTLINKGLDGSYHLEATILFKDSLFKSQIHVASNGMISMDQEELLVEEMPVLDAVMGQ